jgi:FKBP-type peptidyl-prolyl cis-trans isomerase 2
MKSLLLAAALVAASLAAARPALAAEELVIADGLEVGLEYTLLLPDKTKVATNVDGPPLTFIQGSHQILPALESALTGLKAGDTKHAEIAAKEAFGAYDDKAVMTVKKDQIPPDSAVGSVLSSPDGRPVKVLEIKESEVVLDLNHPLAGKDLVFDIKVLSVSKPAAPDAAADAPAGKTEEKP